MKRILPFLLALVSLPLLAQLEKTATFDFSNPESLNPSITPEKYTNGYYGVFDYTFKNQGISMSFSTNPQIGGGAGVLTKLWLADSSIGYYCLQIKKVTYITFTAPTGASIQSITMDEESTKGGLSLRPGEAGTLAGKKWTAGTANVSSVSFQNYGSDSKLNVLTIQYTTPQNILTASTYLPNAKPTDNNQTESFSYMTFTFPSNVSTVSTSGITISGTGISGSKNLNVNVSGSVVTLSLPNGEVFNTDGDYTITVPAGSFRNPEGYMNIALSYSFKVREPRATLVPEISPANNSSMSEIPSLITLTFDQPVALNNTSLSLKVDGSFYKNLTMNISATNENIVEIPLGSNDKFGVYTIAVNEGKIHNTAFNSTDASEKELYDRWNPELTIQYTIIDPLKDKKEEFTTLQNKAKELSELIGSAIGYPAQDDTDNKLADVKDMEMPNTEEDLNEAIYKLNAAIAAFYAQTNVVMPEVDKWYKIIGVNSANTKVYLAYSNGKVSLATSDSQAAAFQVSKNNDGTYSFKTADGKYLMSLAPNANNVTDEFVADVNGLTLEKLLVENVDNEELLGFFSITGWLGTTIGGTVLSNNTIAVNYPEATVAEATTSLFFSADKSSAFIFEEADDPTYVEPINPTANLSATSVTYEQTTFVTLTFTNVDKVALKDASKAYFSSDAAGKTKVTTNTIITKKADSDNAFTISLSGLTPNTYYLQLPVGTFDYSDNEDPVNDVAIKKTITIVEPVSYFVTDYTLVNHPKVYSGISYVKDTYLNDLVVVARVPEFYTDLIPDPTKVIEIVNESGLRVVGKGHFEVYPAADFKRDYPTLAAEGYKGIKMIMDEPIADGALAESPDTYGYRMPEASYGDANFGKYLKGTAGIKKSDCRVNPAKTSPWFAVNNELATGIENIKKDNDELKIYDLNGRRVITPSKGGVYIINGKKVLMK